MTIHLTNDSPDEWAGTFAVTVATLVDDLLSDDEPFHATVFYTIKDQPAKYTGRVYDRENGHIHIGTAAIPEADVTGIVVI